MKLKGKNRHFSRKSNIYNDDPSFINLKFMKERDNMKFWKIIWSRQNGKYFNIIKHYKTTKRIQNYLRLWKTEMNKRMKVHKNNIWSSSYFFQIIKNSKWISKTSFEIVWENLFCRITKSDVKMSSLSTTFRTLNFQIWQHFFDRTS